MAPETLTLEFAPRLVEEAVARYRHNEPDAAYNELRDAVYTIRDPEERERGFAMLHGREFTRLGLDRQVRDVLREYPLIGLSLGRIRIDLAGSGRQEGAELYVAQSSSTPRRSLILRLRPESLVGNPALAPYLRREFCHINDMLDPAFGYDPVLSDSTGHPMRQRLIVSRYSLLWDITIDGRLARKGHVEPGLLCRRRREFQSGFSLSESETERWFGYWSNHSSPTHNELLRFASEGTPESSDSAPDGQTADL